MLRARPYRWPSSSTLPSARARPRLRSAAPCEGAELTTCQSHRVSLDGHVRHGLSQAVASELAVVPVRVLDPDVTQIDHEQGGGRAHAEDAVRQRSMDARPRSLRATMWKAHGWELPADGAHRADSRSASTCSALACDGWRHAQSEAWAPAATQVQASCAPAASRRRSRGAGAAKAGRLPVLPSPLGMCRRLSGDARSVRAGCRYLRGPCSVRPSW